MKKDDLYFDESLLRKMKRATEQAEKDKEQASSDREDDTVEAPVKPEASEDEVDGVEEDDD